MTFAGPRSVLSCAQQRRQRIRKSRRRGSRETRYRFGASLRRRGRIAAGWARSHRRRRSVPRIRRSARDRIAGRGRILASRSHQGRDAQWCELPGERETDRLDRCGQECGSGRDQGRSSKQISDIENVEIVFQRWCWVRPGKLLDSVRREIWGLLRIKGLSRRGETLPPSGIQSVVKTAHTNLH